MQDDAHRVLVTRLASVSEADYPFRNGLRRDVMQDPACLDEFMRDRRIAYEGITRNGMPVFSYKLGAISEVKVQDALDAWPLAKPIIIIPRAAAGHMEEWRQMMGVVSDDWREHLQAAPARA